MRFKSILCLVATSGLTLGATCWFEPVVNKNLGNENIFLPLNQNQTTDLANQANTNVALEPLTVTFTAEQRSALYQASVPGVQDILPRAPLAVVIDSTQPLADTSNIAISSQGIEYSIGKNSVDSSGLTLRRSMDQFAPPGVYTVNYQLCPIEGICQPGKFQFAIDPYWLTQYQDWTHLKKIDIQITGQAFLPRFVRISVGTSVIWHNQEQLTQQVRSEPFNSGSYVPLFASREMPTNGTFSFTFTLPGLYPYYSSQLPDNMTGIIVVE